MEKGSRIANVDQQLVELFDETLRDVYDMLTPFVSHSRAQAEYERDKRYVHMRCAGEGMSFLTKQLPRMGKWFDRQFEDPLQDCLEGYKPYEDGRPRFLRDVVYWSHWISPLEESACTAQARLIKAVRTLFYLFYKLELPYSDEQSEAVISKFVEVDEAIEFLDNPLIEHVRTVVEEVVGGFSLDGNIPNMIRDDFLPHHGPGAVATGEQGDSKWRFSHRYETLHRYFPYYEFMYGIRSSSNDTYRDEHGNVIVPHLYWRLNYLDYTSLKREENPTAKVVLVPKDSRGPRLISCEPLEIQWIQQGIMRLLVPHIEAASRGHINFADQSVNGKLALVNSKSREFCTLDLQEASDRVSLELFRSAWPERTRHYFEACRSHNTLLPDGRKIVLKKFAPMGSALCFPVESVLFYAICVAALRAEGLEWSCAYRSCYVYGDDIIVPTCHAESVMRAIESFGLVVNRSKSFIYGSFRESCGCDAYRGFDITPVKIKKLPPSRIQNGTSAMAWARYESALLAAGLHRSATYVHAVLTSVYGFIPYVRGEQSYLSVVSDDPSPLTEYSELSWNADLQTPQAKVWVVRPKHVSREVDPLGRLLEALTQGPTEQPDLVVVRDATQTRKRITNIRLLVSPLGHVSP